MKIIQKQNEIRVNCFKCMLVFLEGTKINGLNLFGN